MMPNSSKIGPARVADDSTSSLDQNPENNGKPASDNAPMSIVQYVRGMYFLSPPISVMSLVPTAWMTEPAARNSSALKNAWVKRWNMPAARLPAPSASI